MRTILPALLLCASCASTPPASVPDTVRCAVSRDAGAFLVEARVESAGSLVSAPKFMTLPDQWSSLFVGASRTRETMPQPAPDGTGPTLRTVETFEDGVWLAIRCRDLDDGRIHLDIRAAIVRNGLAEWKVDRQADVENGGGLECRRP